MLAEMHDGMQVEFTPEPEIKCEIVMRRHQIGIVIGALGIDVVTARRLHADDDIAETMQAEAEFAGDDMRVLLAAFPIGTQRRAARSPAEPRTQPHNSRAATPRRQHATRGPSSALVGPSCSRSIIAAASSGASLTR